MHADGFRDIVNIDFSATLIERMKLKHKDTAMEWIEGDIKALPLPSDSCDVAIDKGEPLLV